MTKDKHDEQDDRSLGLSTAQVTGSALAAMSGAFLASWLGTTGTLIGAAVASVIATVGAAIYTQSLRRTGQVVKRTAVVVRQGTLLTGAVPRPDPGVASDGPVRDPNAPSGGDPSAVESGSGEEPRDGDVASGGGVSRFLSGARDLPWFKVTLASLAVLLAGLGGVTAVEAITGKPIASWFGRDDGTGTTVGHVVGSDNGTPKKDKAPDNTPAPQEPQPSSEPSQEPEPPQPSTSPVPVPSAGPSDGPSIPPIQSQAPTPAP